MIIAASTPEETRRAIVNYIRDQASHHRRQSMMAHRKTVARARLELANNLDVIAGTLSVAPIAPPLDRSE